MVITLPGARGLFRNMQEALYHVTGKRLTTNKGVHDYLADFHWFAEDLLARPTHILKLVPLTPTFTVNHDPLGYMCGGGWITGPTAPPRVPQRQTSAALQ